MFLNLKDRGLSRTLLLFGDWEIDHKLILEKVLKKNMNIFDIGAIIGYYALMQWKLVGHNAIITAIEPLPDNIKFLKTLCCEKEIQSKKYYKDNIGNGIDHLLTKILPKDFVGDYKSILSQAKELYSKYLNKKARPFDGIYDILDLLGEKNISIGIVTNKIHTLAERCVDLFFNKYNIVIFGAEYLYPKKPAPDSALFLAN